MRVLVCGGRKFYDKLLLKNTLDQLHEKSQISCMIHGGATGADMLAGYWAKGIAGIPIEVYKADWNGQGRSAGPRRNAIMLKTSRPDLVVAFPGGKGTADMVKKARATKVTVIEIEAKETES